MKSFYGRINFFLFSLVILLGTTLADHVYSATILVDTAATGNNDGSSWLDAYTSLQAETLSAKPYWILVVKMVFGLPIEFLLAYFQKRHFTGGSYGFVLAMMRAFNRFLKNAKLLEAKIIVKK